MEKVAAIVVTYNRRDMLAQCLDMLQMQTFSCDILVVDNASTDGTESFINEKRKELPCLKYHRMVSNLGGAGGFNAGMRWAVEAGYEYTWIMDDDCLPKPDALEKLMAADKLLGGPERYGFLSSVVLWTDGKECQMNRQGVARDYYKDINLLQKGIIRIFQATFVSLLIPAKTIRQFGLPIKEYFIWGDDIEYTHRITLRGNSTGYLVGKSHVVHAMKNNMGSNIATDTIDRIDRYWLAFRNESYTYRKEGVKGVIRYCLRCARGFFWVLRDAKDHRIKRTAALIKGILQGLFFDPAIEYVQIPVDE